MPYDAAPAPADAGAPVVLPDGLSRADILAAVGAARLSRPDRALTLVGHGSSGVAVLSLALHQRRLGLVLAAVTCRDAADDHDPISGAPLPAPGPPRHPTAVTILTASGSRWAEGTAAAWREAGWEVTLGRVAAGVSSPDGPGPSSSPHGA
ncbi:hypothetical protein [Nocardioides sambongensis]|uniref:hypothetical protein n=1 Tax=Nocardioides sambongensis TaxID=2589074 RepID=UPI00112BA94C|nr:hypothetical protein [Nocardioides sambongensis]